MRDRVGGNSFASVTRLSARSWPRAALPEALRVLPVGVHGSHLHPKLVKAGYDHPSQDDSAGDYGHQHDNQFGRHTQASPGTLSLMYAVRLAATLQILR